MIAVVGGGITGMTIAEVLRNNGKDVLLIEKEDRLGGQCRSVEKDDINLDRFYHAFYPNDFHLFALLKKLNLLSEIVNIKAKHGFFSNGQMYSLNSIKDLLFFRHLSLIERAKLGWTLWKGSKIKDWSFMQNRSSKDWLIRTGGIKVYNKFWEPMLRSKFREGVHNLSGVDIGDRINRLNKGNVTHKIKKRKVSKSRICYLKGKLFRMIKSYENLLQDKGVIINRRSRVEKIASVENNKIGLIINHQLNLFEKVFFALPTPFFASMIPKEFPEYKKQIETIQYMGNVCLILIVKKPLMPFYVLAVNDRKVPFTAVIGSSNLYDVEEFNGHHVYYITQYFFKDLSIYRLSEKEIFNEFLKYLRSLFPDIEENIKAYLVTKVRYAEPYYSLGFKPPETKTPIPGVYLATGAQVYPSLPTIDSSIENAARAVLSVLNQYID